MGRDIEDYLILPYTIKIERDKKYGGYLASVKELPGCIAHGETQEDVYEEIKIKKENWLKNQLKWGLEIPLPERFKK